MDVADPARIPSEVADAVVAHLAARLLGSTFGPVGPVVVIFAGKFAGELTHRYLDISEYLSDVQDAVSAVEIAGTFADARIGRLAESGPFRGYISDLVGSSIAKILPGEGQPPTATAVVAVYEVRSPADGPAVVRIRPASFTVWTCVPQTAVADRWESNRHEKLQLTDGTIIQMSPDGSPRRQDKPANDGDLERRALAAAATARAEAEAREREEKLRREEERRRQAKEEHEARLGAIRRLDDVLDYRTTPAEWGIWRGRYSRWPAIPKVTFATLKLMGVDIRGNKDCLEVYVFPGHPNFRDEFWTELTLLSFGQALERRPSTEDG